MLRLRQLQQTKLITMCVAQLHECRKEWTSCPTHPSSGTQHVRQNSVGKRKRRGIGAISQRTVAKSKITYCLCSPCRCPYPIRLLPVAKMCIARSRANFSSCFCNTTTSFRSKHPGDTWSVGFYYLRRLGNNIAINHFVWIGAIWFAKRFSAICS